MCHLSVIVLTHNPSWEKLKATILSVLNQEKVWIELIIADDGSLKRFDEEIKVLCERHGLLNVKFSSLRNNIGTVGNITAALRMATAPYVKLISPGDFVFSSDSLEKWCYFMEESDADISFGDAVYYREESGNYKLIKQTRAPIQTRLYENYNRRGLMVDCLMVNDNILGASIMIKTDLLKRYMELFNGKVKYAEDYFVRLAVFEQKKIMHFPQNIIWYEYGLGISTNKKNQWKSLLYNDFVESNKLIMNECMASDRISRRYVFYLKNESKNKIIKKIKKCLMFPDVILWKLKNLNSGNKTDTNVDSKQLRFYLGLPD